MLAFYVLGRKATESPQEVCQNCDGWLSIAYCFWISFFSFLATFSNILMMTLLDQEQPAPAPHEPFSLKILSTVQALPRDNPSRDSSAKSENSCPMCLILSI